MFLTQVSSQGFVFLHLFLKIHTKSRGDTWSNKDFFGGNLKSNKPKGRVQKKKKISGIFH